jgi:hypothetical protein
MTKSNAAYRAIRDSRYLTSEQKNQWMKQIARARNKLARETVLWSKMYDAGIPQMLQGKYDMYEQQQGLFENSESYADRYKEIVNLSSDLKPKMKVVNDSVKQLAVEKSKNK